MTNDANETHMTDETKPPKPKRRRYGSAKFPLDPECLAILDAEIEKQATTWHRITLSRGQVLGILLKRAYACTCGADARPMPTLTVPPDAQPLVVGVNPLGRSIITCELDKLGAAQQVRLHRYQVLRLLLQRAARCTCPQKPFDVPLRP